MQPPIMWNCTLRNHLEIVLRSVKWNEGQPLQRLFSRGKKEIITQILTWCIHAKSCLSSTQPTSTAHVDFGFSPANHLFSHYKLVLKAYTVTKQSSHLMWFFFPANLMAFKRKMNEAALLQCGCIRHICQSMHQGVKCNQTLNWAAILFSLE